MNSEDPRIQIKYLLLKKNFKKAEEIALKNNLKNEEREITEFRDYYMHKKNENNSYNLLNYSKIQEMNKNKPMSFTVTN